MFLMRDWTNTRALVGAVVISAAVFAGWFANAARGPGPQTSAIAFFAMTIWFGLLAGLALRVVARSLTQDSGRFLDASDAAWPEDRARRARARLGFARLLADVRPVMGGAGRLRMAALDDQWPVEETTTGPSASRKASLDAADMRLVPAEGRAASERARSGFDRLLADVRPVMGGAGRPKKAALDDQWPVEETTGPSASRKASLDAADIRRVPVQGRAASERVRSRFARLLADVRPVMGGAGKPRKATPGRAKEGRPTRANKTRRPAKDAEGPPEPQAPPAIEGSAAPPEPQAPPAMEGSAAPPEPPQEQASEEERHLVVFKLAGEGYGVDLNIVREIIRMQEITRVPKAREFVEGVINLRGRICPVIDLRKRFGVAVGEVTEESRIIVVEKGGGEVGVIVDAVAEVLRISSSAVAPPAERMTGGSSRIVEGIANLGDRLIMLVDLEAALGSEAGEDADVVPAAA